MLQGLQKDQSILTALQTTEKNQDPRVQVVRAEAHLLNDSWTKLREAMRKTSTAEQMLSQY